MARDYVFLNKIRKRPNLCFIMALVVMISNPLMATNLIAIGGGNIDENNNLLINPSNEDFITQNPNIESEPFPTPVSEPCAISAPPPAGNFQYPRGSSILPLAHAQTEAQLRDAYKALFNRIYSTDDVELVMNSFKYNSIDYPVGTLASMNEFGGNFNCTHTTAPFNITAGFALHPKKIAVFKSELSNSYGQNLTWEEGYFERLFRVYLWGDYFDTINETGIRNDDLMNYEILIIPSVIKDYEKSVVNKLGSKGQAKLRKFVRKGNLLYAQGGSCYLAEAAWLVPNGTVLLDTRIDANNNHANMDIVDGSSIMAQNWLSDRMYLIDDPVLNATNSTAVIAKYTGNLTNSSLLNTPAIMNFNYRNGLVVLVNGHPSVNNDFYPIVFNAILMGMAEPPDLRASARQLYNGDVPPNLIPAQEPNVTVEVNIQYLNFWPVVSKRVVTLRETISPAFSLDKINITPKPSLIKHLPTNETEITWAFNDTQGITNFTFYVKTYPNTTKKGIAFICTGVAKYTPLGFRGRELYHDDVYIKAALAAHLNGDRDIELDGCYPLPASGFYYDIALPLENKEETTAKNITITDIVVLKSPIVDVDNQTRVPEAWNNTNNGTNDIVFAINEIFYYYDEYKNPLYPLPDEVYDTNYTYQFGNNCTNITLPAKKLVWHYPDIIAYDYQEPAIRYGIFTHEEHNRTVSFMSDPYKDSVILNASGGSVYTNLGIHPVPYHEYLSHAVVYIPTGEEIPAVDYDDIWNRNHTMELRTVFYDIVPFPPPEEHMVVTTTFEMTQNGTRLKEFPIHHDVDLKFKLKTWNGYGLYDPKTYPYHMDITKNETMIVQAIPTGVGYNIDYVNSSFNDNTSLLMMENTSMHTILYFQQDIEGGHKEVINITANLSAYPEVHREGRMKINDGARFVYHQIAVGPSRYEVFDSHVQAVFAVGNDVQVDKKVAPVYIATFGDDVYQFIQLEDPYEPHEFDQDPYIKSYGFGDMAATTYVGGRINETLYHARVSPGGRTLMRLEVDNNLGYDLENVTITPVAPEGFTVTPDNFTTQIPPIFFDFPFINRTDIWDAWKAVYYYWVDINESVEGGCVYQINFTFQSACSNATYIPADFEIPPAQIGVKDDGGHVKAIIGRAVDLTLGDTMPAFVRPEDVRIANKEEQAALELMLATGVSHPGKYNRSIVNLSYQNLRKTSFQKLGAGKINVLLPTYAQMLPWLDNTTDRKTLYVIIRTNVTVNSGGTYTVNTGPSVSYKNHFNETVAIKGYPETIEAHGPAFNYGMTITGVQVDNQPYNYMIGGEINTVTTQVKCLNHGDDIAESSAVQIHIPPLVYLNEAKLPGNAYLLNSIVYWTTGDIGPGSEKTLELEVSTTPPPLSPNPNRGPPEPWLLIEFAQVKFIHGFLKKPVSVPASAPLYGQLFDSDLELSKLYCSHAFAATNITHTIYAEVENNWRFTNTIYDVKINFSIDESFIGSRTIPVLTPGESTVCSLNYLFDHEGTYKIKATIVEPKLNEFYNNNNELEYSIIVVDPVTVMSQPDFKAGFDTYITDGEPNTAFGDRDALKAGLISGKGVTRTYINFDTSGIPSNALVLDAKLKLYMYKSTGSDLEIKTYQVLSPWYEDDATWENMPDNAGDEVGTAMVDTTAGYKVWDVTSAMKGWVAAPDNNYGLLLKSNSETAYISKEFYSSDQKTTLRPIIVVHYAMLKSKPDITTTNLAIAEYEDKELRLEWAPVPYSLYYEIYRASSETGPYSLLGSTWDIKTLGSDGTLNAFYYDDVSGGTPNPPSVITTDRAGQPGTIRVTWEPPAAPAPSPVYYYRLKAIGVEGRNSELSNSPTEDGQLTPEIVKYYVYNSTSVTGPWTKILGETETLDYIQSALGQGKVMYYRVKSETSEGYQSGLSDIVKGQSNTPPTIGTPYISPSVAYTTDYLYAKYPFSDVDGDTESGSRIRWYRNGTLFPWYKSWIRPSWTEKGQAWYFTITPKDGIEFGTGDTSVTITILNSAPALSNVKLEPSSPKTKDDLKLYYTYSDADSDPETNTKIRWYKDSIYQSIYDTYTTIPSSGTVKNEIWNASIITSDGTVYCSWVQPSSVKVKNSLPVTSELILTPDNPLTADALKASYTYSDADSDTEQGTKIYWYKDNQIQSTHTNKLTVPASATLKDEQWYFTVTPHDGEQSGVKVKSSTVKIENSLPEILDLKLNPQKPRTTDLLWVQYTYFDADSDPDQGTEIKWYCNDVHMDSLDNTHQVPLTLTTRGEKWKYTIKPKDGFNFGKIYNSNTVTIQNTVPEILSASITPAKPAVSDELNVEYEFSDADFDTIAEYYITWFKDSEEQEDLANLLQVPMKYTNAGEIWYFEIQVSDGIEFGSVRASNEVKINELPMASNVFITPSNPITSDLLILNYDWSDADNEDLENGTLINWFRNGELAEPLLDSHEVQPELTAKGDKWYFTVTPNDGKDYGGTYASDPVLIGNTEPEATELKITPLNPTASDELSASYQYFDLDGDLEYGSILNWYNSDLLVEELIGSTVVTTERLSCGEVWYFTLSPSDGEGTGELVKSPTVVVVNTIPVIELAVITPESPATGDILEAYVEYIDIDHDLNIQLEYQWFSNDNLKPELYGKSSVPALMTTKGEVWFYTVRIFDGTSWSEDFNSDSIVIRNTAPEVTELSISPEHPTQTQELTVDYIYSDMDGDPEEGTEIRWFRNGDLIESVNDKNIVPVGMLRMGDEWYCTLHPSDGSEFGTIDRVDNVKINTIPVAMDIILTPFVPAHDQPLMINYEFFDIDNDAEGETVIEWYHNGEHIADGMRTLPAGYIKPGDRWYVIIKPHDGLEFGFEYQSNELLIPEAEDMDTNSNDDSTSNLFDSSTSDLPLIISLIIICILIIILIFGVLVRRRRRKRSATETLSFSKPEAYSIPPEPEPEHLPGDKKVLVSELLQQAIITSSPQDSPVDDEDDEEHAKDELDFEYEVIEEDNSEPQIPYEDLYIEFQCNRCNEEITPDMVRCPNCGERFGSF